MGIYDREYYRDTTRGGAWRSAFSSATKTLIILNVAVFLIVWIDGGPEGRLYPYLYMNFGEVFRHGQIWRLLTAAFLHLDGWHLAFNMLFFWFVGREMEGMYGRREFTAMYITAAIVSNLCWAGVDLAVGNGLGQELGASGAVWAVIALYTLYYPNREIYLFGIIPLPMWLLATLYLGIDLLSLIGQIRGQSTAPVAFAAHLGGAGYGALYKMYDLRWSRLLAMLPLPKRGPTLRIARPDTYDADLDYGLGSGGSRSVTASPASRPSPTVIQGSNEEILEARVDEILAKIASQGRSSLTEEENRLLQEASRRARAKRSERF